jgi:hypothetical protein
MTLRLNGATSGYTEIDAPAVAGSNTLVLPTGNGSDGNILGTDGAGNLSWVGGRMVLETAQASTSGTSVDFTGIPSWVKRVTVMFDGVSGNGASDLLIQLGDSGGIETTGYKGSGSSMSNVVGTTSYTAGIGTPWGGVTTKIVQGLISLSNITGNTWVAGGVLSRSDIAASILISGSKTLSDVLTQVRITHVNGTDTFDAGSINLLLEG